MGRPLSRAKWPIPFFSGNNSPSRCPTPTFGEYAQDAARRQQLADLLDHLALDDPLAALVKYRPAQEAHDPGLPGSIENRFAGSEKMNSGRDGKENHDQERIRPTQMIAGQDGAGWGDVLEPLDLDTK